MQPSNTAPVGTPGNSSYINPFSTTQSTPTSIPTPTLPTTLNSSNTQSNPAITIPTSPSQTNLTPLLAGGSSIISSNNSILNPTAPVTSTTNTTDTTTPTDTSSPNAVQTYIQNLLGIQPVSSASTLSTDEQNANISGLQSNVDTNQQDVIAAQQAQAISEANLNGINAQIDAITGQGTAKNLALQNEGGAITTGGVASSSAANIRDAAIQAIPLQAQAAGQQAQILINQANVAAAQGNATLSQNILSQAQSSVNQIFSVQQTDATNQYNYQKSIIDAAYSAATTAQQQQLDDLKTQQAQDFSTQQNNLNEAQTLANTAISNGDSTVAGQILALDPTSSTFTKDLGVLSKQIQAKTTATETWSDPYTLNGQTVQKSSTGEIRQVGSATSNPQDNVDAINHLINTPYSPSNAIVDGKYNPSLDIKYTDSNGYLTAQGFQTLVQNSGISRADFLAEFGSDLDPKGYKNYQLTPAEITALNK